MIERAIERTIFASRWLMAPFYLGLIVTLALLLVQFARHLIHLLADIPHLTEADVVLGVLSLIDLSLAGNLVMIVVFSGYENFVSKIDTGDHEDQPDWKGKVDFAGLKLKLITSIVAISGIHLLKIFMDIPKYSDRDIMWAAGIHVIFVISGVMLALMDRIGGHAAKVEGPVVH